MDWSFLARALGAGVKGYETGKYNRSQQDYERQQAALKQAALEKQNAAENEYRTGMLDYQNNSLELRKDPNAPANPLLISLLRRKATDMKLPEIAAMITDGLTVDEAENLNQYLGSYNPVLRPINDGTTDNLSGIPIIPQPNQMPAISDLGQSFVSPKLGPPAPVVRSIDELLRESGKIQTPIGVMTIGQAIDSGYAPKGEYAPVTPETGKLLPENPAPATWASNQMAQRFPDGKITSADRQRIIDKVIPEAVAKWGWTRAQAEEAKAAINKYKPPSMPRPTVSTPYGDMPITPTQAIRAAEGLPLVAIPRGRSSGGGGRSRGGGSRTSSSGVKQPKPSAKRQAFYEYSRIPDAGFALSTTVQHGINPTTKKPYSGKATIQNILDDRYFKDSSPMRIRGENAVDFVALLKEYAGHLNNEVVAGNLNESDMERAFLAYADEVAKLMKGR